MPTSQPVTTGAATLPAAGSGTVMPTSQPVTTGAATLPAVGSGTVMPTSQPVTTGAATLPAVGPGTVMPTSQSELLHSEPFERVNYSGSLTIQNAIEEGQLVYPELLFIRKEADSGAVLEVTQQKVHTVPGSGSVSVARIPFVPVSSTAQFTYDLQILFSTILQGDVSSLSEFFEACSVLSKKEDYKFCPGLDEKTYLLQLYQIPYKEC